MTKTIAIVAFFAAFGGWIAHLYACFTLDQWAFLFFGAIIFPVGVVHGWGVLLGFW
ncbi:hypothetical protein [Bauldia litoralis]|uniref:hypothetical protein n=1 Tax=Bauldia litoralis TaxID=665467 RepID=UPI0032643678